jgi:N-acetylglucosamine kinase-like BadF-type ATPase
MCFLWFRLWSRRELYHCTEQLQVVFTKADILVKEDLLGAAYAVYRGKPTMVCILGTGSNSCYFDGKDIKVELPSLGFLLGDDGAEALWENVL